MDYAGALAYLRHLGDEVLTMKFGLENIRSLLRALDDPQLGYPSVLIGGTNGKGSVARFLHGICEAGGVRSGLYTSPHLVSVRERVQVGESMVSEQELAECLTRVAAAVEKLDLSAHPTYFETVTATALLFFRRRSVQLAVLEVGMGGHWDSTNAVEPLLSVLTSIGLDHQKYLGGTLTEIAREKAGIMRRDRLCLTAPQRKEVRRMLHGEAARQGALLQELDISGVSCGESGGGCFRFRRGELEARIPLCGRHQVENALLAVQAAQSLRPFSFTVDQIRAGIENTRWAGRIDRRGGTPELILDGAHNPEAARALAAFLEQHTRPPRHLVFAVLADKDAGAILQPLRPLFEGVFLTRVNSPRAASPEELAGVCPQGAVVESPRQALQQAAPGCRTLVAAGSFYLVGELLADLEE